MRIIFYGSKPYDKKYFVLSNKNYNHDIRFVDERLNCNTVSLVSGEPVACVFVNDVLDRKVVTLLAEAGVKLVALRCAGFNNIDIDAAKDFGLTVIRVPAYSPDAVAEHAVGLMLSLNRKIHLANNRVHEGDFSLDGLLGFDFSGKTIGIVGTGRIGSIVARIMSAMGMNVLAYDLVQSPACVDLGVNYVTIEQLYMQSDVISLHCPLNSETEHLIDEAALDKMKDGVMLVNTGRGALLDTCAAIKKIESKKIGYLGLDVYENESKLFFENLSGETIQDDVFQRLLTFPNVLITAHQGFFTSDALINIADTTLENITLFSEGGDITGGAVVAKGRRL